MHSSLDRRKMILSILRRNGYMTSEQILAELIEEEYSVSISTIRRDVDILCMTYPIICETGRHGGIRYCYDHDERGVKGMFWRQEVAEKLYSFVSRLEEREDLEFWDAVLRLDKDKCFIFEKDIPPHVNASDAVLKILLDVKEFAEYMNISTGKAYELLRDPQCPYVMDGNNKKVINRYLLDKWIEANTGKKD